MPQNDLLNYIKDAKAQGLDDSKIRENLKNSGWDEQSIENAIAGKATLTVPTPPSAPHPQSRGISSIWDAFEHILMFISLYVLYTSLGLTLHYFIDRYLPQTEYSGYGGFLGEIASGPEGYFILRGYLSALIVSTPLFSFFFLRVTKRTAQTPEIRRLQARKTLIYFTLVVTFMVLLFNSISTIYTFLSGNVTINFILHLVVNISLSAIIFAYYLNEVKEDRKIYA